MGYGNISPKNCFKGGQETNCRLNNLICAAAQAGHRIEPSIKAVGRSAETLLRSLACPPLSRCAPPPEHTVYAHALPGLDDLVAEAWEKFQTAGRMKEPSGAKPSKTRPHTRGETSGDFQGKNVRRCERFSKMCDQV